MPAYTYGMTTDDEINEDEQLFWTLYRRARRQWGFLTVRDAVLLVLGVLAVVARKNEQPG